MARFGTINQVHLGDDGSPLAGGKLYFYDSGTLDEKNTYSDLSETTANANPVVLDAYGRQPDIFFSGSARCRVLTSADVLIDDMDPLPGIEYALQQFAAFQLAITYSRYDIVLGSDGEFYESAVNANSGNDPTSTSGYWNKIAFDTVSTGLTAGTTQTQAGGLALTATFNEVATVANTNDTVVIPAGSIGDSVMIVNNGANAMRVFPPTDDQIQGGSVDAADAANIAAGEKRVYTKVTATNWTYTSTSSSIERSARTSNTILGSDDNGKLIDITANTFTQTLTAAATLGDGWFFHYKNSGTGVITLDPDGSETINGSTTLTVGPGDFGTITCDGSNFHSVARGNINTEIRAIIESDTVSASATLDIEIPTGFDDIEIILDKCIPVTDNTTFLLRTSTDGGSTFPASSDYSDGRLYTNTSGTATGYSSASTNIMTIASQVGSSSNETGYYGTIRIWKPTDATYTRVEAVGTVSNTSNATTPQILAGQRLENADVDYVRLAFDVGNIEEVEYSVIGIKRTAA